MIYANDNWMRCQGGFANLFGRVPGGWRRFGYVADKRAPRRPLLRAEAQVLSAFLGTALPVLLHQLQVDGLVLVGMATDSYILATALEANMREYLVSVPEGSTAAPLSNVSDKRLN